jgi:trehalose-phosphatase
VHRICDLPEPGNLDPSAVFLDFEGTLAAIVPRHEDAAMAPAMRAAVERLARRVPVAVVSGRDLADVKARVGLTGIAYAGGHGFDIEDRDGRRHAAGPDPKPALDAAEAFLAPRLAGLGHVRIERKARSVAVHVRSASSADAARAASAVDDALAAGGGLRKGAGKAVFELQPAIDWHKGRAVLWLLQAWDLDRSTLPPVYVGDDLTDEDAFQAIAGRGVGIVVGTGDRPTHATFALPDTAAVQRLLEGLAR